MSLFSWLSPKKPAKAPAPPVSSGLSRMESTKPYNGSSRQMGAEADARPANRKNERMARRELLYAVVRECMVKAGVLSSSYKFKVLSLDPRGRQFLVMVDLAQGAGADTVRLAEVEAAIAQQAKARYDIVVNACYWRSIEHVAVGDPVQRPPAAPSRPAPLEPNEPSPIINEAVSQPAELMPAPPQARGGGHFDPLHPEEVAAFKRALAAGSTGAAALQTAQKESPVARSFDGAAKHGPQSYTLLTGFEDTEMAEDGAPPPNALSATQYGELR